MQNRIVIGQRILGQDKDTVRRTIEEKLWQSVNNYVLRQASDSALATHLGHFYKSEKVVD